MSSKESLSKTAHEAIKPPPDEFPRTQDLTIARVVVNRAREQREAVKAIKALRGSVVYDWELQHTPDGDISDTRPAGKPTGPTWLRRITGDDYFQEPEIVTFLVTQPLSDEDILKAIPYLQRLRRLKQLDMWKPVAQGTVSKLQSAIPHCEVRSHQKR